MGDFVWLHGKLVGLEITQAYKGQSMGSVFVGGVIQGLSLLKREGRIIK